MTSRVILAGHDQLSPAAPSLGPDHGSASARTAALVPGAADKMASVDDEMDDAERDRDRRGSPERRPRDSYRNDDEEEDPRARGKESMELAEEDAAFVLGRGGMTKKKIERACNAVIDVNEREYRIEITGTKSERKRARDYLTFVMQQRVGAVVIDTNKPRDDLTILSVPEDCVAFVMGRGGQTLRTIEEEWATLMFFAKVAGAATSEKLMIFGDLRARRGAELKVMSAIEHKKPGYYVQQGDNGLPESVRMSERYEGDALPPDAVRRRACARARPRARALVASRGQPAALPLDTTRWHARPPAP